MAFHNQKTFKGQNIKGTLNKPVLHKKGKRWIVVSLSALVLGLGLSATQLNPSANNIQAPKIKSTQALPPSTDSKELQPSSSTASKTSNIEHQASAMHKSMVANKIGSSNNTDNTHTLSKSSQPNNPVAPVTEHKLHLSLGDAQQNVWADIQYVNSFTSQPVASDAKPNEPIDSSTISNYAKNIPGCKAFLGGTAFSTTSVPTTSANDRDVWQFSFTGTPSGKATWAHPDKLPDDLKPKVTPQSKPNHPSQPVDNHKYDNQTITVHYIDDNPSDVTYGQEFMAPLVAHYNHPIDTGDNTAVWHPSDQIVEFIGYDKNGQRHYYTESQLDRNGAKYDPIASEKQYPIGYRLTQSDEMGWYEGTNVVSDISQSDASDQSGSNHKSIHPFFFEPYNQNVYLHYRRDRAYINLYFNADNAANSKLSSDIHLSDITNHPVNLVPYIKQNIDGFKYSPDYSGKSYGYDPYTLTHFDNALVNPQSKIIDDVYSVYVPASDSVVYTYNGHPIATAMKTSRPSDINKSDYDHQFQSYASEFDQGQYDKLPSKYSISNDTLDKFRQQFATDIQSHNYGYGYYNYEIPVHLKDSDTVNYVYNGQVIKSKSFNGPSDQSDTGLDIYYNVKSANDWSDIPYGYQVNANGKSAFFHQMADYFQQHQGLYSGATINIPLIKPQSNIHIYYEDASDGHQIADEAVLNNSIGSEFNIHNYLNKDYAPSQITNGNVKYSQSSILHSVNAFDNNDNETHTIDVLYHAPVKPKVITKNVPGPTKYITKKVNVPGPTKYVNVPGPTKYITKNVPGPIRIIHEPGKTKYVSVQGPTQYITKRVPGKTITKYITKKVNVPGPTKYITKNIPGPVRYITKQVPGPKEIVHVPGKTETKYVNVPGPTKIVHEPGKTITKTVDVPGPTRVITHTIVKKVSVQSKPKIIHVPGKTVTKYINVPGPVKVEKVPGPTITKVVYKPSPAKVIYKTITQNIPGPTKYIKIPCQCHDVEHTRIVYVPKVIKEVVTPHVNKPKRKHRKISKKRNIKSKVTIPSSKTYKHLNNRKNYKSNIAKPKKNRIIVHNANSKVISHKSAKYDFANRVNKKPAKTSSIKHKNSKINYPAKISSNTSKLPQTDEASSHASTMAIIAMIASALVAELGRDADRRHNK